VLDRAIGLLFDLHQHIGYRRFNIVEPAEVRIELVTQN
jgi:hypothetical protein